MEKGADTRRPSQVVVPGMGGGSDFRHRDLELVLADPVGTWSQLALADVVHQRGDDAGLRHGEGDG